MPYRPDGEGFPMMRPEDGAIKPGAAFPDFSSLPPDVLSCAKHILGEGVLEQIKSGELSGERFAEAVKRCFYEAGGVPPPPIKGMVCPAMPTVDQCPAGQRKAAVFSSPECGTYYTCKPEGGEICIQVVTPARDPATGYCKNFPTPCDVPQGWSRVDSCEPAPSSGSFLPALTPEVVSCLKNYLSEEMIRNLQFQPPPPDALEIVKRCYTLEQTDVSGGNLLRVFAPFFFFLR
jgi:hypothetical protein